MRIRNACNGVPSGVGRGTSSERYKPLWLSHGESSFTFILELHPKAQVTPRGALSDEFAVTVEVGGNITGRRGIALRGFIGEDIHDEGPMRTPC